MRGIPILAALYHPPGAVARHDAVAWGYAMGAAERGVEIHQLTEVTGLEADGGRIRRVQTTRGTIAVGKVLMAVAGSSSRVAALAGLSLPIRTQPLQACVSEPVKPALDPIVVSGSLPRLCQPILSRRIRYGRLGRPLCAVQQPVDTGFS